MVKIGRCILVEKEIWVALYGLRIAWDSGYRRVCKEIDST